MACGLIFDDIENDCANPLVGGASARLILLNVDDVVSFEYDVTDPNIITGFNLTASPAARAYVFEGYKNSVEPSYEQVPGDFFSYFNHQVIFRIFKNTPDAKNQINAMNNGKFYAIVENNYRGDDGNGAFELYGLVQGLEVTAGNRAGNDTATQGAHVITLSSPANYKEPKLPNSIFDTDYTTTKALVDALL